MSSNDFSSPSEVHEFVEQLIKKLQNKQLDATALVDVQSTTYTSGSEWQGQLGVAVRQIQKQNITDPDISQGLDRIIEMVKKTWPNI